MKRPDVTMEELWAAQAQFGPFDTEVIQGFSSNGKITIASEKKRNEAIALLPAMQRG